MPALPMPSRPTRPKLHASSDPVVDLERYVPAFLTWIANKLSRGASQHYLAVFDVGIETWRCLVLLAIEGRISAQKVSKVIGMDKASVSRTFKSMQSRGLITFSLDDADGRLRLATLTKKGRALHGTFWHDGFGRRRSHGCVNLSVADAEWLFRWAPPELPGGWHAVAPRALRRGMLWVQVEAARPGWPGLQPVER